MSEIERVLPHSLEAERSVLGAVMLHAERLAEAAEVVKPEHFFRAAHADVFRAFLRMEAEGQAIDLVTVTEALGRAGTLDAIGGPVYLASLIDGVPKSTNVEHYAEIVREKARLRAMITVANTLRSEAYAATDDAKDVIDRAEQSLLDLSAGQTTGGFVKLGDILPSVLDQIEAWRAKPGAVTGIPSGLIDLDAMTRGFQPGTLVVIAARPGMGKSSLAENIARHAATLGKTVGVFSLEMGKEEYGVRSLSSVAKVDGHRMQRGYISEGDTRRIGQAFSALADLPVYISDSPYLTPFDVRSKCRLLKMQAGLDLVIVDYTQLMLSSEKSESRAIEVGTITRALKALSKDLKIPVLALAQLNRELERRENKRPMLSDLRDSGRIEEDADIVLFIYREDRYNPQSDKPGVAELIVSKHRQGPTGTVEVRWVAEETRFENLAREQYATDRRLPVGDR